MKTTGGFGTLRRFWFFFFLTGCAVFLVIYAEKLLANSELPSIRQPIFLVLALALQAGTWILLAGGWQRILAHRLGRKTRLLLALHHLALLSLGKYLPGKVWGLVARGSKMAAQGIETDAAVDTTALEQVIVLHSAAIVSATFSFAVFPAWVGACVVAAAIGSMAVGHRLVGFALSVVSRLTSRFSEVDRQPHRIQIDRKTYAALTMRYSAAWVLHGLVFIAIYLSLSPTPLSTGPETVALLVFANTSGMLIGFVAVFAPAGIGVREAAIVSLLASQVGVGNAIILSIAMRLWTVATDVVFGGLALLASGARDEEARDQRR
jgi:hypothetical protein